MIVLRTCTIIINGDLTGVYYRDEILEAFVYPYVCAYGQKGPVRTWLVLSMSTLSAKEIELMDWSW